MKNTNVEDTLDLLIGIKLSFIQWEEGIIAREDMFDNWLSTITTFVYSKVNVQWKDIPPYNLEIHEDAEKEPSDMVTYLRIIQKYFS